MSEKKNNRTPFHPLNWLKRAFFGGSKEFADQVENRKKDDVNDVEEIVTPAKQAFRNFMEHKLAVAAMCVVIAMFLFVFIAPLFMTNYKDAYTEVTQKNVRPGMDMMSVPAELKNNVRMIDSYGSFSVGVNNDGKVFVWGDSVIGTTKIDVADIPEEVLNDKIAMVAAGIDHVVAISEAGKVYCWGNYKLGQYIKDPDAPRDNPNIAYMPDELLNGTIDVSQIKKLACGYQCSAILMQDGTLYLWGNKNTYANFNNFLSVSGLTDIGFTINYIVGLQEDAKSVYTGTRGLSGEARANLDQKAEKLSSFLGKRTIESFTVAGVNLCLQLSDGSICFVGDFRSNLVPAPVLPEDEYFVSIAAGTYHYTGLTNKGNVYSFGENTFNQSTAPKKANGASQVYSGAFQNYAVDDSGKLIAKWGLKGYLFGTDSYGADIFQRIANGGRMTMTIGAVAVIISSIIGIIIGCISGYFGGKVDMFLMRVTEIFAAIPFLPFALILSSLMSQMTLSENMRIFIIMVILGVLSWTGLARLVRGQVLVARENEYVLSAKAMGVSAARIAFKHILPNVISVILVTLTLDFATCMLTESSLSYLGFGVNYPRPTWGNMLEGANNSTVIKNYWWQWVFTSGFLAVTTICINIVGDTLRDVLDPKSNIDK